MGPSGREQRLAPQALQRLRFLKDDQPLTDPSALHAFAQEQVAQALQSLRRKALLTA